MTELLGFRFINQPTVIYQKQTLFWGYKSGIIFEQTYGFDLSIYELQPFKLG